VVVQQTPLMVFLVGQEAEALLQMLFIRVGLVFLGKVMPLAKMISMPQGMPQVEEGVQGLLG
jgi:hypothetical protein